MALVPDNAGSTEPEVPVVEAVLVEPVLPAADLGAPVERAAALQQAGGLIAATFETLVVEPDEAPSETELAAVAAAESEGGDVPGVSTPEPPTTTALAKRTVTSVPVGSDGQPDWSASWRPDPEARSAAAFAARDVASAVEDAAVEPLAFAAPPEAVAPRPEPRPEAMASVPEPVTDSTTVSSAVNVRSGPSGSHQRLFVLPAGADVEATHARNGWVRIVDEKNRDGWVYSEYLSNVDLDALPAPDDDDVQVAAVAEAPAASADVRSVKGQGVNVRSGPSSSSGRLFALRGGTKVTVTTEQRGWLKITDPDGRSGWAYEQFLTGG